MAGDPEPLSIIRYPCATRYYRWDSNWDHNPVDLHRSEFQATHLRGEGGRGCTPLFIFQSRLACTGVAVNLICSGRVFNNTTGTLPAMGRSRIPNFETVQGTPPQPASQTDSVSNFLISSRIRQTWNTPPWASEENRQNCVSGGLGPLLLYICFKDFHLKNQWQAL